MYLRPDGRVWVNIQLENWQKPEALSAAIAKAAEGMIEVEVGWDSEDGLQVTGARFPTPEDQIILAHQREVEIRGARQRLRDLRHSYPMLFDGNGRPREEQ